MVRLPFRNLFGGTSRRFSDLTPHVKVIVTILILTLITATGLGVWKLRPKPLTVNEQKQQISQTANQINTQNYKQALNTSQKLVADMPADSPERYQALSNLGVSYMVNRQYDQALDAFLQAEAIKKDQSSYSMFIAIAQIYTQKGDKTKAIEYYEKGIKRAKATPEDADDLYIPSYEEAIKRLQQ